MKRQTSVRYRAKLVRTDHRSTWQNFLTFFFPYSQFGISFSFPILHYQYIRSNNIPPAPSLPFHDVFDPFTPLPLIFSLKFLSPKLGVLIVFIFEIFSKSKFKFFPQQKNQHIGLMI